MDVFNDRRILYALIGGALALLAGLGIAVGLMSKNRGEKAEPPPASQAGLVVEAGAPRDDGKLDPTARLRCFVAGQFVGEATLAECAKKNGVATGALDVGVDEAGNLAAADQAGTVLTPLPPTQAQTQETTPVQAPAATSAPTAPAAAALGAPAGACMRYVAGEWRKIPGETTLNTCVQVLFAGHCEHAGGATYGRWMQQTLRLVPGKIEVSSDNRSFHTLVEQGQGCAVPNVE